MKCVLIISLLFDIIFIYVDKVFIKYINNILFKVGFIGEDYNED